MCIKLLNILNLRHTMPNNYVLLNTNTMMKCAYIYFQNYLSYSPLKKRIPDALKINYCGRITCVKSMG